TLSTSLAHDAPENRHRIKIFIFFITPPDQPETFLKFNHINTVQLFDSKNDVLYFVNRYFLLCIYYEIIKNNTLWVVETGYKSQAGVVRMFLPPQYQTAIVS
ncbi:TPA: hypothetical protein ACH7LC_005655, partial [Escherichia coli]